MKVPVWWMLLAAAYSFLAGIAVSHSWGWLNTVGWEPFLAQGWMVATAQIATLLVPWCVFSLFVGNKFLEALSSAVRGQ